MYLIYQHGKVASQTIEWSIRFSDQTARIERHHYLSDDILNDFERVCRLEEIRPTGISADDLASERQQVLTAREAKDAILNSDRSIFVLSGFRDPLDFAISAFFQNVTNLCPWLTFSPEDLETETERTTEVFACEFERFLHHSTAGLPAESLNELNLYSKFETFDQWFDREFLGVLGIDVFKHQIGTAPISQFQEGRFTVLLYRMETLRDCLPALLRRLPLSGEPVIRNENIGSTKVYGQLYANFRSRFIPTSAMSQYYYDGRYFAHFYAGSRPLYFPGPAR